MQEAIAYHELLHVRRRDWLWEILEEVVRSVLWFHPAIWWLIGRVQLTREQVVDEAAIQLTDSRERYVESLLAVALAGSPAAFTPASPFLRRHLLKKRVARILQETTMTTRRLIASLTASAAALTLAATFAVRSFPLEAQGQAPADNGAPIQIVKGSEHLLHGDLPQYPGRAIKHKVEGDVVVDMTLNDRGEVSDARVLSGPEELRKAALEAVLQWHYAPSALSSTVTQATLRFRAPVERPELDKPREESKEESVALDVEVLDAQKRKIAWAIALKRPDGTQEEEDTLTMHVQPERLYTLKLLGGEWDPEELLAGELRLVDVMTERVSAEVAKELLAQAGVTVGDAFTKETAKRLREVAREMDEHFDVDFRPDKKGGVIVTIGAR